MSELFEKVKYKMTPWNSYVHGRKEREIFIGGAAGPGKSLSLDTIIPTAEGFKYLKDLHVGDTVFNSWGRPVKIIAETDIFTGRPCYALRIGSETIIADEQHEWEVLGNLIVTTEQIYKSAFQYCIDMAEPVQLPDIRLPVDPYILGVCLIRGQKKDRSKLVTWSPQLHDQLKKVGYSLNPSASMVAEFKTRSDIINGLISAEKRRIPFSYLYASFKQRMAFLEGIVDGCDGKIPSVNLDDYPLLCDMHILASSLGLASSISNSNGSANRWTINIASRLYRISRLPSLNFKKAKSRKYHRIKSILPVESVPTKCIQVEGSNNTFLITKSYIPTRNSMVLLMDPVRQIQVEHLRCSQDDKLVDKHIADPVLNKLIKENPLRWGHSEGSVLHLRRTLPRLTDSINRSKLIFPVIDPEMGINGWKEKSTTWKFSSGLEFRFGHCKDRGDHINYLGLGYTEINFDELIEFNKEQYDFITSRLRSSDVVLRLLMRVLSASNPRLMGNKGEDIVLDDPTWVKKYFVDPHPEGRKTIRKKVVRKDGTVEYLTRIFVPATLYDNPDPGFVRDYELTLLGKPKHIREAYLYGKWDVVIGSHFAEIWNPTVHVCKPFKIPSNWAIFRSGDWGFAHCGNIGYYAVHPDGHIFKFYEFTFKQKTATEVAEHIKHFEEKNKLWDPEKGSKVFGPMDKMLWEERGSSFSNKYEEMVAVGVDWCRADQRSRETNCEVFTARLMAHQNFTRPPGIIFFENCKNSIQTIPSLNTDPTNLEVPKKMNGDDWYDETTYAMQYARQVGLEPPNYKTQIEYRDEIEQLVEGGNSGFGYWS